MLSIGEFSNICKVSAKTLRYYAEKGLLLPDKINPENGYRYYAIEQLETMLLINRLKSYHFSLEDIKTILDSEDFRDEALCSGLIVKKRELEKQVQEMNSVLDQLNSDISNLKQGISMMSYLDGIDVLLTKMPEMYLQSIRKMVHESDIMEEYSITYRNLLKKIEDERLTIVAPPMVLFHNSGFCPSGLDIEFAIPVKEISSGARLFRPGLCFKTVLSGSYAGLPSVYTKQCERAEKEGYVNSGALYEVYVTDPSQVSEESELITEIYYPVKKKETLI